MAKKLRIVLAQLNLTVGDIEGNLIKHLNAAKRARDELSADLIVFPELSLTGYPPEDLLLRKSFIETVAQALKFFRDEIKGIHCIVGHPEKHHKQLLNACSLIYDGDIIARYAKHALPNYGVFDEYRYFTPKQDACVVPINNVAVGLIICEDLWTPECSKQAKAAGAEIIICPNASPFETIKHEQRLAVLTARACENHLPIFYNNLVGGQDELIFDGGSMVVDAQGKLQHFAGFFNEKLMAVDVDLDAKSQVQPPSDSLNKQLQKTTEATIYEALTLSIRDYINKNNFPGVLLGLSGGIDSALTLTLAVDALGPNRVKAIIMPSRYTQPMSIEDANKLADNLQVKTELISIESVYEEFLTTLAPSFTDKLPDITEENLQARCRAVILMALSNKYGHLVLTTGNRSELAVGYCTLYGDMAGGFGVLKDVPKTLVYELAHYRNRVASVIPQRIIERPPTAELAENQKDEDTLPPYPILDQILFYYLNLGYTKNEIIAKGFATDLVDKIINMIYRSEYKRRQSAIGPRIYLKSFGRDWRYPVTNKFKG